MLLKRKRTLFSKNDAVTKHIYSFGSKTAFILGVYTMNTAKFYFCDRDGNKKSKQSCTLI